MKIVVTFDYPPIPVRNLDYSAYDHDTYDGAPDSNCPIGHGPTAEAAVKELAAQWDDDITDEELYAIEHDATDEPTQQFLAAWREIWR